jgi:hypothetical protein
MTSGNWTVGSSSVNSSTLYARKVWSGADGKYETWNGGSRLKWNSYLMWHRKFTCEPIWMAHGQGNVPEGTTPDSARTAVAWNANDDLRVLDKLAQKVRGHSFDLGVNLAESTKTYRSILSNLHSLGNALIAVKHGNFSVAWRYLGVPRETQKRLRAKDVSGRWLEMQYGWLPLVSQSYEAAKALETLHKPRSLKFTASVKNGTSEDNRSINPSVYEYWVRWSYGRKILANLYEDLTTARSLGMVDPRQVLWEIVPYSFVVDWFIPVGTYLSAAAIVPKLRGRFLICERGSGKHTRTVFKSGVNPALWHDCHKREDWFSTRRTPASSLPMPAPTFNSWPKALSPKRLLNGVALIHQVLQEKHYRALLKLF